MFVKWQTKIAYCSFMKESKQYHQFAVLHTYLKPIHYRMYSHVCFIRLYNADHSDKGLTMQAIVIWGLPCRPQLQGPYHAGHCDMRLTMQATVTRALPCRPLWLCDMGLTMQATVTRALPCWPLWLWHGAYHACHCDKGLTMQATVTWGLSCRPLWQGLTMQATVTRALACRPQWQGP